MKHSQNLIQMHTNISHNRFLKTWTLKVQVYALSIICGLALPSHTQAAQWTKLHESSQSKLMLDKQSVIEKDQLKKAWLKIEYKTPQKNLQDPEKSFNLSKVLWYFNCPEQKSATAQVAQYLNGDMVFSAGIDAKNAEFIEPVPESDVDIAMRYVCKVNNEPKSDVADKANNKDAANKVVTENAKPAAVKTDKAADPESKKTVADAEATAKLDTQAAEKSKTNQAEKSKDRATKADAAHKSAGHEKTTGHGKTAHWTYEGQEGPENWGKLDQEFATCSIGRNQSPINIDDTIDAPLKKIRGIQKFPAKEIFNNGHTVQVNFGQGNMLVLDNTPYQMKQVHFHSPSENTIRNKSFPLEAHFVHADSKGNLTVIGVMFKEGAANQGLAKLWEQMPNEVSAPMSLKNRVIANDIMPENRDYYRFSGSLTTPPCSEGVRWIVLKTPLSASKEQIEQFKSAVKHSNNRPVQALNGRVVLE
jgi:carbonic anhydrase